MWLQHDISPFATTSSEVASYADLMERRFRSRPGPKTTWWCKYSEGKCACRGHCRAGKHRAEGKCDCTELVIGTVYCNMCKCNVTGCDRPRNHSDFCFHHKTVFEEAPFCNQLAVIAAPAAPLLMPCDIVDFIPTSAIIQDDLAMLILTAAIRETLAVGALVEAWKELPEIYSGSDLRSAVLRALAASDGVPQGGQQLAQLHRGKMGLFFGLVAVASNLGIIMPKPRRIASPHLRQAAAKPAGAAQQTFCLGVNLTVYEVLDPSASKCDKFLDATRAEDFFLATSYGSGASTPGLDAWLCDLVWHGTQRVRDALMRIGARSGVLPFSVEDTSSDCMDFLIMKLVAARALQQNLHECDWRFVDKGSLLSMGCNAKKILKKIPDNYNARDISYLFTGRANWGLFASMFPCLWQEVADQISSTKDRKKALMRVQSQEFLNTVQSFRRIHGIAPHPAVAFDMMRTNSALPDEACWGTSQVLIHRKQRQRCSLLWQKKPASRSRKKIASTLWNKHRPRRRHVGSIFLLFFL